MEEVNQAKVETATCPDMMHSKSGSIHPHDKVPKMMFFKDPNNSKSPLCKACYDCRGYRTKIRIEGEKKRLAKLQLSNIDPDSNFQSCTSTKHTSSISIYPKDKVPKSHFRQNPADPNSKICRMCYDCRNKERKKYNEKKQSLIVLASNVSEDSEFGVCVSLTHARASDYPKDKVPKHLFRKYIENPNSEVCKMCYDCRKFSVEIDKVQKEKREEELKILASTIDKNSEFQLCPSQTHTSTASTYPRDKVPKTMFLKDPNNPDSEKLETCLDCREKINEQVKERRANLREIAELKRQDPNAKFVICIDPQHQVISKYKRDEVPRHMFMKFPENPKSPLRKRCSDCRCIDNERRLTNKDLNEEKVGDNEFYCRPCNKIKPLEEQATKLNGEKSKMCKKCLINDQNSYARSAALRQTIKMEIIKKNGCSCEKCKKIFLRPETSNSGVIELSTYERDNIFYVTYKDREYTVENFLDEFEELLELRILEYDHLTEEEQRERGLLGENDIFVPKKDNLCHLAGEDSIRLETVKTQLIDSRCHTEETIRRQLPNPYPQNKFCEEKMTYVNKLKCKGCSVCGFYDPTLHRFLDFDHLIPKDKVECIAEMVRNPAYSMEDLIKETDELVTRILCKFCHAIHTDYQRKAGII